MLVSIIIPVIRPEKAKRCIAAIKENAGIPEWAGPPSGMTAGQDYYEIVTEEDTKRMGVAKMVKRLTYKTRGEAVCFLGDDTIPQKDFLKNGLRAMAAIPEGWGLVSFNDNPNTTRSAAHWIAHKKLLPFLEGEFFHTGYQHCFVDDELLIRCQEMNRYIYAYDAVLYHEHPAVHKDVPQDESFKRVHSEEIYGADHKLFTARMRNRWKTPDPLKPITDPKEIRKAVKVAIGIPSNDLIHADFALCLVNLCIYSIARGVHCAIINQKSSLLEIGRNQIVQSAFEIGADWLLSLDSDMTFPAQTLQRLLYHKQPIVCADASRRREPIHSVLIGMDGQRLKHDPAVDEKSPLVEVKGGSNAVSLISMEVFKKLKPPHFLVEYNEKKREFLSEDFYFSNRARIGGYKIYCDPYLSPHIGHIGAKTYFLKDEIPAEIKTP